jgi:hypothetical protein
VTSWQSLDDPDLDPFLEFPINSDNHLSRQPSRGQDNALVTDVTCQASEVKPVCRIAQMMAEQIIGQGLGDSVQNDLSARGSIHQHRFDPAQVEGSALTRLQPGSMAFMQADPVEGTDGNDRFVRDDFGFNQEMVTGSVADDFAPAQSPFKSFEQADLFDDCSRGQVVFKNGLELMTREDGRKIENLLNGEPVPFVVGHNLQSHPFSEEDHDFLVVPLGELASERRFYFLDDFGGGKGVPAGERQNDGLHG